MNYVINNYNITQPTHFRQEKYSIPPKSFLSLDLSLRLFSLKGNGDRPTIAKVMDELLYRHNVGKSMKVSHQTIATKVKRTRLHVGKILIQLEKEGHISVLRTFRQENIYIINPMYSQKEFRLALKHLLPELDDKRVTRRKREADEICVMTVAKNYWKQSDKQESIDLSNSNYDFDSDLQKKHHSLKGIYYPYAHANAGVVCEPEEMTGFTPVVIPEDFGWMDGTDWSWTEKEENIFYPVHCPDRFEKVKEEKRTQKVEETEVVMKNYELKSIKLTDYGQIRLQAFPEEAIRAIDKRMLHMKERPDKPWNYFIAGCKRYCEEKGLVMDWTTTQQLLGKHCVPDQGPFIDESFIPSPVFKKTSPGPRSGREGREVDMHMALANQQKMNDFGLEAMARQQHRAALEWEEIQQNEPEKFERLSKSAAGIRQVMGLRENGTFLSEEHKEIAVEALVGFDKQKSEKSVYPGIQKCEKNDDNIGFINSAVSVCMDYAQRLVVEVKSWADVSDETRSLIGWFISNLKDLPEDYEKTYMLIKQILQSAPTEQSERILVEVVSNLKRIVNEECNQEALA